MYITMKDFRFCLDTAAEMTEQYKLYVLAAEGFPRSVDNLLELCTQHQQKQIEVQTLDLKDKAISGMYVNFGTRYAIVVDVGLNQCWKRFVICKELFHVLLDAEEYRNMNIYAHLEEVKSTFPLPDSHPGSAAISEAMAEIAAMEFLFPYSSRVAELAQNATPDYLALAHKYKIPQVFVENYLSPSYMENIGAMFPGN